MENMEKQSPPPPPPSPSSSEIWEELLAILSEEELIRFGRRFELKGKVRLARLLEVELNKRGQ